MKAVMMSHRQPPTDPAEAWLVTLLVIGAVAAGGAVSLCWRLLTGGVW